MALSGTFTGSYKGCMLQADWSAAENQAGNYSDITVTHKLVIGSACTLKIASRSNACAVDGQSKSYTSPAISQTGGTVTLGTTAYRVDHNEDGSKSCAFSDAFNVDAAIDGEQVAAITATGTIELDPIKRYATITGANDFTDEGNPSFTYSNPAGFTADAILEFGPSGAGIQIMRAGAVTEKSGSYTFNLSVEEREKLRAACVEKTLTVRYVLQTTIDGTKYRSWLDRTMSILEGAPVLGDLSYRDGSAAVAEITGDNQIIVQDQSDLQVAFTAATGQKGATISGYTLSFAGLSRAVEEAGTVDFGKVDVSDDAALTLTAVDSRGNESSKSVTVKVAAWRKPDVTVDLHRFNNFEAETHLSATAFYADLGGRNTATISAKYRAAGSEDWSEALPLEDGADATIVCDRDHAYEFIVTVADKFASVDKNLTLGKGIPLFFYDTKHSSVGVNCLPTQNDVLQLGDSAWLTGQGAYPVGSVYMSVNDADPGSLFGGVWERIEGRFLLAADDGTQEAGSTGGEAERTLTVRVWQRTA